MLKLPTSPSLVCSPAGNDLEGEYKDHGSHGIIVDLNGGVNRILIDIAVVQVRFFLTEIHRLRMHTR